MKTATETEAKEYIRALLSRKGFIGTDGRIPDLVCIPDNSVSWYKSHLQRLEPAYTYPWSRFADALIEEMQRVGVTPRYQQAMEHIRRDMIA